MLRFQALHCTDLPFIALLQQTVINADYVESISWCKPDLVQPDAHEVAASISWSSRFIHYPLSRSDLVPVTPMCFLYSIFLVLSVREFDRLIKRTGVSMKLVSLFLLWSRDYQRLILACYVRSIS
jgi:hypothetical protein